MSEPNIEVDGNLESNVHYYSGPKLIVQAWSRAEARFLDTKHGGDTLNVAIESAKALHNDSSRWANSIPQKMRIVRNKKKNKQYHG